MHLHASFVFLIVLAVVAIERGGRRTFFRILGGMLLGIVIGLFGGVLYGPKLGGTAAAAFAPVMGIAVAIYEIVAQWKAIRGK